VHKVGNKIEWTIIHHFAPAVQCDLAGKFHLYIQQGSIVTILHYISMLEMPYHLLVIVPTVITGSSFILYSFQSVIHVTPATSQSKYSSIYSLHTLTNLYSSPYLTQLLQVRSIYILQHSVHCWSSKSNNLI